MIGAEWYREQMTNSATVFDDVMNDGGAVATPVNPAGNTA